MTSPFLRSLLLGLVLILALPALAQDPTAVDKAFGFAAAAEDLAKEGDFDGAIRFYQKAYDLVHDPVLLYNIGRMHDKKGDLQKAREFYERYLQEDKDPEGRARATAKLDAVLDRIPGRLLITTEPPGATTWVDGRLEGLSPVRVDPIKRGSHDVVAKLAGYDEVKVQIAVVSGEEARTSLVLKPAAVSLTIACDCPGSRVELDGKSLGNGPLENAASVFPGRHTVAVVPETGEGLLRTVEVAVGKPARIELKLRPEDVLVRTAEALARDGDLDGAIRLYRKAYDLKPEPGLLLELGQAYEKKGDLARAREQYEKFVAVAKTPEDLARGKANIEALLDRVPGRLSVEVDLAGAVVELDGTRVGTGPFVSAEAKRGPHEVRARMEGYEPAIATVAVKPGEEARVSLILKPSMVSLTVACDCPKSKVVLDGNVLGKGPLEKSLPVAPGHHVVRVEPEAGEPVEKPVEVVAGTPARVEVRLVPPRAPPAPVAVTPAPPAPAEKLPARPVASVSASVPAQISDSGHAPREMVTRPSMRPFPWHWVAMGTGAALVVTGGVLTGLAARDRGKITGAGTEDGVSLMSRAEALSLRSSAASKDRASYALYAVGGAAVATGVVFWILDVTRNPAVGDVPAVPVLSSTPGGVSLGASGRF